MAIGDTSRGLQLGDGKGIIRHVNECTYLEVRVTKGRNHETQINEKINRGRAAVTKINSILWDRDVTLKTKTNIYHAVVKSINIYAAETWFLYAKTVTKLNYTEMDLRRRSA